MRHLQLVTRGYSNMRHLQSFTLGYPNMRHLQPVTLGYSNTRHLQPVTLGYFNTRHLQPVTLNISWLKYRQKNKNILSVLSVLWWHIVTCRARHNMPPWHRQRQYWHAHLNKICNFTQLLVVVSLMMVPTWTETCWSCFYKFNWFLTFQRFFHIWVHYLDNKAFDPCDIFSRKAAWLF